MLPGMSPRDLKRMLKRMGIELKEIEGAEEVVIRLKDKEVVIEDPQVVAMETGRQIIFQVVGKKVRERARSEETVREKIEASDEDIEFIIEQTGATREVAEKALVKAGGDLAEAILLIREGRV